MKKLSANFGLFEHLLKFLESKNANPSGFVVKAGAFSRKSPLTFKVVAIFLLHMTKRSLSIELEDLFDRLGCPFSTVTKSALSQARYKLKWEFFQSWNAELVRGIESGLGGVKLQRYKGLRLYGIDGTTFYLVNTPEISEAFGTQGNDKMKVPMARSVCRYDVLNEICDWAQLYGVKGDELTQALAQVESLPSDGLGIHDRGHASFALMKFYQKKKRYFLIRLPVSFNNVVKDFIARGQRSATVEIPATKVGIERLEGLGVKIDRDSTVQVRLVRVTLDNGETEVLATNLPRKKFGHKRLKRLYFRRWGIETYFDRLKNKLQVEQFCGHLPMAIHQEFWAVILLSNLHAQLVAFCREGVRKATAGRYYEYKTNYNVTIGLMKSKLVAIFLLGKLELALEYFIKKFTQYVEPVRPGRSLPRKVKTKRSKGKYQTMTNYRAAA